MSRVYTTIDPSWSYHFFKGIQDEIKHIDYFQFTDKVYRLIADYVRLTHNFRLTNSSTLYSEAIHSIWKELELLGNIPVPYFQDSFRKLFTTHMAMFNALPGHIGEINVVTTDTGELQGFVLTVI